MNPEEFALSRFDDVANWAASHGYDITAGGGSGKGVNHPVQTVTWYECVKWCNARSEKEGRTACYTVGGNVYKTGNNAPDCNWSANGYRLPTEAEWEKAARGGVSGQRFPWGDTIQHTRANYYSSSSDSYDTSFTRDYHPDYDDSGYPYTSPVGAFAPNGYGLYDMAGNVWEWCNDRYGSYSSGSQTNPRGPTSGSDCVLRGGGWGISAYYCRVAFRDGDYPGSCYFRMGFRACLPSGQQ